MAPSGTAKANWANSGDGRMAMFDQWAITVFVYEPMSKITRHPHGSHGARTSSDGNIAQCRYCILNGWCTVCFAVERRDDAS